MNSDNQTTLAVDIYDTATGQWSKDRFAARKKQRVWLFRHRAEWTHLRQRIQGDLLRLAADEKSWEVVGSWNIRACRIGL
jgi:hypothetical protein